MTRVQTICIATIASAAIILLCAVHLDSQGAYYDELHQAPAAFRYIGSNPIMFTWAYRGVPMLNMPYSGAIKSGIYGAYLKYIDPHFSIKTWRSLGIGFVAIGVFSFYLLAGSSMLSETAWVFALLLLTDVTVVVTTRHDWGPTALALALRLIFLGLWLSIEFGSTRHYKLVLAGLVAGVSVFEKLSSIVMVVPFLVLVFSTRRRLKLGWVAAAVGLAAGVLPLVIANVATYRQGQGFISLSGTVIEPRSFSPDSLFAYAYQYLALGQGWLARETVLGASSNTLLVRAEVALMLILLAKILDVAIRRRPLNASLRLAGWMAATYIVLAVALLLLPRQTYLHHWVIGTPFQYVAIALALPALERRTRMYKVLGLAVVALIVCRLPALAGAEKAFLAGVGSPGYDPAFNRLTEIAALRSRDALFIASDWGSATQIYCGGNGLDDSIAEPFWSSNPAQATLDQSMNTKKTTIYIVTTGLAPQFTDASTSIIKAMTNSQDWKAVPVEREFEHLGRISVRKFERKHAKA